jgi:hypothetical protein
VTLVLALRAALAWLRANPARAAIVGGSALAAVLAAVLVARCSPPARVEEKHEASKDSQSVATLLAQLEEASAKDVHTETTEETRPDGSKVKHTVRDEHARTDTHATTAATETTASHEEERESKVTERERARHRLALMPGWKPRAFELMPAELSLEYTQRVVGPFSAGAFVRGERVPKLALVVGVSLAVEW